MVYRITNLRTGDTRIYDEEQYQKTRASIERYSRDEYQVTELKVIQTTNQEKI